MYKSSNCQIYLTILVYRKLAYCTHLHKILYYITSVQKWYIARQYNYWFIVRHYNIFYITSLNTSVTNRFGHTMVSMLPSSAWDYGLEAQSSQTKDYKIDIYCFSVRLTALRRKSEDWLAWNQDNVSECRNMSPCGLLVSVS